MRTDLQNIHINQKDLDLFRSYYQWVSGTRGPKYLKPIGNISEVDALKIQRKLENIEYNGKKINTHVKFNDAMTEIHNGITDAFTGEMGITLHSLLREGTDWNKLSEITPEGNIGDLPRTVDIDYNKVMEKAKNGEIDWLKGKDGEILKGDAAERAINEMKNSIDELIQLYDHNKAGLPLGKINNIVAKIGTVDQMKRVHDILINKEQVIQHRNYI